MTTKRTTKRPPMTKRPTMGYIERDIRHIRDNVAKLRAARAEVENLENSIVITAEILASDAAEEERDAKPKVSR